METRNTYRTILGKHWAIVVSYTQLRIKKCVLTSLSLRIEFAMMTQQISHCLFNIVSGYAWLTEVKVFFKMLNAKWPTGDLGSRFPLKRSIKCGPLVTSVAGYL